MKCKFKVGDKVMFDPRHPHNYGARKFSTAVVTGNDADYVIIKWLEIVGDKQQNDGGYFEEDFCLITEEVNNYEIY